MLEIMYVDVIRRMHWHTRRFDLYPFHHDLSVPTYVAFVCHIFDIIDVLDNYNKISDSLFQEMFYINWLLPAFCKLYHDFMLTAINYLFNCFCRKKNCLKFCVFLNHCLINDFLLNLNSLVLKSFPRTHPDMPHQKGLDCTRIHLISWVRTYVFSYLFQVQKNSINHLYFMLEVYVKVNLKFIQMKTSRWLDCNL